jgi:hypothetical protein
MIIYSFRSTCIISLQLHFCLFENNLRTGAMVRHVNESLFWKYKWPNRKSTFRPVINYEIKRNTSSRLAFVFIIKTIISVYVILNQLTKQSNYTIYYFWNKCFDQCQSSVMASRWSIYTCSTVENNFFYLCCRKIFLEFSNICPNRGRCIWEKHYIGIASSLQTSGFVKCFIYKIV